jgi:RHH-type transcriptional regulator, proline utilization regulon repressor / proline dehydrogenase / delta 1-pyrroline-5-carboxylate dehydrogenase
MDESFRVTTEDFAAPYAPPDETFAAQFLSAPPDPETRCKARALAADLLRAMRQTRGGIGGVEDFLQEFKLSSREGLAVMTLAEALVRAPDNPTADLLLADKLASGDFAHHKTASDAPLVQACAFALGFSAKLVGPEFSAQNQAADLTRRLGAPVLRAAARRAMALLGGHFVFGETIQAALLRAKNGANRKNLYSYDMLGEGARAAEDAEKHFGAYAEAIRAIARAAEGDSPAKRTGISIKLSALHPRYEAISAERVRKELTPRLLELARLAKDGDLGLTVDAEEADRLELSLDLFGRVAADPCLRDWDGLGLAVQAYQKRARAAIDHVAALARRHNRRFMVRLVKGAYWDSEIKRAQERGLADFPVFSRKPMTDLNYLACAEALLAAPSLFPQFATHNALTAAAIVVRAGDRKDYEFQRLHGMGEALHEVLRERSGVGCRVYAPVGPHRDLLAYLVRRLIENGANSSFVARAADPAASEESLLADPFDLLRDSGRARHAHLRLPGELFAPARKNSRGVEFGDGAALGLLQMDVEEYAPAQTTARPTCGSPSPARKILSPIDGAEVGQVFEADAATAAVAMAAAQKAFPAWSATPVERRVEILFRVADDLESQRGPLIALLQKEAGKTLDDALAEVREAADLCRYYAAQALAIARDAPLPGPSGEENFLRLHGRGVFVCISPWNFPLAIFVGQVAAALVAGNAVAAKPAPQTPLVARKAVDLFLGAGCPEDLLQYLPGDGFLGAALVSHPLTAGVVFTGSTATARKIGRALAAKDGPIAPLIAETGGINAMIVDSTALLEQVVDDAVTSAFRSAGQRCSALRLLCLQEDIFAPALAMLKGATRELRVGDPRQIATHVGPVIDAQAKARLDAYLAECAARGRIVHAGSAPASGQFVAPHIILLERAGDLTSEVFGPVLHVTKWRAEDFSALIHEIAATGFGLTIGLHTRIERRIAEFSQAAVAGNIYVNRNMIGAVVGSQPFGGFGLSGTGPKAGGPDYLRRFFRETTLTVNTASFGGDAGLLAMDD